MAETKLSTRLLNYFGLQTKAATPAPDLGRYNYFNNYPFSNWHRHFSPTNHKSEVGDLDLNSLAMAVVNYTASRIPEAKPSVVTRTKDGDIKRDFLHPMASVIRRPNRHHVWANYAGACSMSWWFSGNVYFYKSRAVTDEVVELWYLPHFLVTPRWPNDGKSPEVPVEANTDSFLSHYQYDVPGRQPVLYPANDVVHLKRHVDLNNPRLGLGAFESLYKELYGDDKMALFTASIMSNMGVQVPLISPKEKDVPFNETQSVAMREMWKAKTTGARAGEPVIMTEPVNVEKFGFNPSELDLSNLRLIPESRVSAVTGIPAATLQLMVGLMNGTSYASSEQARQQGYEEVIIPIQQVWAEEFNWQLLPEFEKSEGLEFEFDTSNVRVLEEDRDALYKRESDALRAGGITINEFLQSIGKKPLGDEGDIYYVPSLSNPMTLERLAEAAAKEPQSPPAVPAIDPASLAKFADLERWFEGLESQMKDFSVSQEPRSP